MLVHGQFRQLEPAKRLTTNALEDGREVTVIFPAKASIEVHEPTTVGSMGGSKISTSATGSTLSFTSTGRDRARITH